MLALGGAAVLAAGAVLRWYPWWAALLVVISVSLSWLALRDRFSFLVSLAALIALGFYAYSVSAPPVGNFLPLDTSMRFEGIVAEDPVITQTGWRAVVDVSGIAPQEPVPDWNPARGRVMLSVEGWPDSKPSYGDIAVFRTSLREPLGFVNPGGA